MVAQRPQVIGLEDVEGFAQRDPAGARRRRRLDVVAPIGAADRRELAHRIGREVAQIEDAAAGPAGVDDRFGDVALVEGVGAARRDRLEGRGEIGLDQPVADLVGRPVLQEHSGGRRILAELLGRQAQDGDIGPLQDEPVAGEPDRRRHDGLA